MRVTELSHKRIVLPLRTESVFFFRLTLKIGYEYTQRVMANNSSLLNAEICLENSFAVNDDGELLDGLWYIGVSLSIFSSVASNLGVNTQKFSLTQEIKRVKAKAQLTVEEVHEQPYLVQPIWLLGLLLIILGAVGDFAALGFAAQSLATPVGGFTLVANMFFGHFLLKEHIGKRDLFATLLILCGVVLVAVSGEKTEKTFDLECLLELYKRKIFIFYIIGVILVCISLLMFAMYLSKLRSQAPNSSTYLRLRRIHPIIPTALSGILGSQSVLFAKSTAEILKVTFTEENQLDSYEPYLIVLAMLATIFSQLHWLAHSLRLFDALLVVPLFQCFFISGGVVGGAVFFDEFKTLSETDKALFGVGLGLILLGVYTLSFRKTFNEVGMTKSDTTVEANAELQQRIDARLSVDVRGGSFLGINLVYQPASSRKLNPNILEGNNEHSQSLGDPNSLPADLGTPNSLSKASTSSAPTPISVMPQFAITDAFTGIKEEIRKISIFGKAEDKQQPPTSPQPKPPNPKD